MSGLNHQEIGELAFKLSAARHGDEVMLPDHATTFDLSAAVSKANGVRDVEEQILVLRNEDRGTVLVYKAPVPLDKVEADPHGMNPHQSGAKLDAGKPDMSLMLSFGKAIRAVAEIATFGAKKYTRDGWLQVPDGVDRYTAADLRHLLAEGTETHDPDSNMLHAAHHAWNALARLELMLRETEEGTE